MLHKLVLEKHLEKQLIIYSPTPITYMYLYLSYLTCFRYLPFAVTLPVHSLLVEHQTRECDQMSATALHL